jgi:hypothetical protein
MGMAWEVNTTDFFVEWYCSLTELEQDEIIAIVELLAEHGPELDRPCADRIKGSPIHNMKELRPRGIAKHFRVLFVFDPRREAILLTGGDKSGQRATWYVTAIPLAERLYADYLDELRSEGLIGPNDQ